MTFKKQVIGLGLALLLAPAVGLAQQEKIGTITAYDKASRMVTVKGEGWEEKATVTPEYAKTKADLLKKGTQVSVRFEHRSGGDLEVKVMEPIK